MSRNFQIWKCLLKPVVKGVVKGVAARGKLLGWNPNLTAGTLTLLQVPHVTFFLFYLNLQ